MKNEEIKIKDNSGDKDFFTIIPNYILNHSTHWDREVYIQMKRIAGEGNNGKCYMSIPKLALKCGMGKERLINCIKYLIKQKWITYLGKILIQTAGGKQLVNAYKINNIWKLNSDFYHKGGSPQGYPQDKGGSPQTARVGVDEDKGGSPQGRKEEPIKKNPFKKRESTPSENFLKFLNSSEQKKISLLEEKLKRKLTLAEKNEIENFISYWTEKNQSGTKQRWQLEKTFEYVRRIGTWFGKADKFNGIKKNITGRILQ